MTRSSRPKILFVGAVSPLLVGAAPFNDALVAALAERSDLTIAGWDVLYPSLLFRKPQRDDSRSACRGASFDLRYSNPLTWRRFARAAGTHDALVLPWLHPVMALPYRYLLRSIDAEKRVVICHNVVPHESLPFSQQLTAGVLKRCDVVVTHAPMQREELAELGVEPPTLVEAFHPRFPPAQLAPLDPEAARSLRHELGDPELLLLCYGVVRPYKGVDTAVDVLARLAHELDAKLVVAGRIWEGREELVAQIERLDLHDRVVVRDEHVSDADTATLFGASDIALLPYRSASQSGVVQMAFSYGCPVVATTVGGLPAAIRDGVDGVLCPPDDPAALTAAVLRMFAELTAFRARVEPEPYEQSFARYAALLTGALGGAPPMRDAGT